MDFFSAHMANRWDEHNGANANYDPTYSDLFNLALAFTFSVLILPGNTSFANEFISNLKCHIRQLSGSWPEDDGIISISKALFCLVILWTCPADNNHDIFEMVKNGQVSCIWTNHEHALAAWSIGADEWLTCIPFTMPLLDNVYNWLVIHMTQATVPSFDIGDSSGKEGVLDERGTQVNGVKAPPNGR